MRQTLSSSLTKTALGGALLGLTLALAPAHAKDDPSSLAILGTVEDVKIPAEGIVLEARLDTGATSSSLNALNKEKFERDGDEWIRFDVVDPDDEDAYITLERPIERNVRIRQHSGESQERPVISMEFCIGDQRIKGDTTLIDRTNLTYQALIGRTHLAGHILVDSGAEHTHRPDCGDEDS
ncbi:MULTISPECIES: RimK/LysX family protein [unclassified Thioalkalivibrio]|uniref:ATP-dependent zinc protease family protein n=1 Tax=unclassified Thioalkalivibrio TaxID=2621013 RepID=UPI000684D476|nr:MULTISPECIES: RimK/LysX family protein [unclassified Thioalkalivibrio]